MTHAWEYSVCKQVEAVDGEIEEAAAEASAHARPDNSGLMGQISLQTLLDQSTAPPGFYRGASQDLALTQDLDRAKSTSYQVQTGYLNAQHKM